MRSKQTCCQDRCEIKVTAHLTETVLYIKGSWSWAWELLRRLKQTEYKFKAYLSHRMTSKSAWATSVRPVSE